MMRLRDASSKDGYLAARYPPTILSDHIAVVGVISAYDWYHTRSAPFGVPQRACKVHRLLDERGKWT